MHKSQVARANQVAGALRPIRGRREFLKFIILIAVVLTIRGKLIYFEHPFGRVFGECSPLGSPASFALPVRFPLASTVLSRFLAFQSAGCCTVRSNFVPTRFWFRWFVCQFTWLFANAIRSICSQVIEQTPSSRIPRAFALSFNAALSFRSYIYVL